MPKSSDLDRFIEGRERVLGWDRGGPSRSLDPDNVQWLPLHTMIQSQRYRTDLLEQRVADLEDRVAS